MVMVPVMGITWIFGIFAINRETLVFQFLFAILNSCQVIVNLKQSASNLLWYNRLGLTPKTEPAREHRTFSIAGTLNGS